MLGKEKCRILKEIRQKIADENDIPYVTRECRFQGECRGTCPRCEGELRYLEKKLAERAALGRKVSVAALCAGMALAAEAADAFIVDCKDMDPAIYRRYTGGDGALMESNLRLLLSLVGPERIRVRVPRIPSYNTAEDQARSAARLRGMGLVDPELFDYVIRKEE